MLLDYKTVLGENSLNSPYPFWKCSESHPLQASFSRGMDSLLAQAHKFWFHLTRGGTESFPLQGRVWQKIGSPYQSDWDKIKIHIDKPYGGLFVRHTSTVDDLGPLFWTNPVPIRDALSSAAGWRYCNTCGRAMGPWGGGVFVSGSLNLRWFRETWDNIPLSFLICKLDWWPLL